jgi:hypothetical protein
VRTVEIVGGKLMHRLLLRTAAGLCLASLAGLAVAGDPGAKGRPTTPGGKATPGEPTCGNHGTSIDFVDTPSEAAKRAKKEGKLVFVLHVSGHFEDPRFT